LVAKANALLPLKGFSNPDTLAALSTAKRLLDAGVGNDLQHFVVLYGLCAANYIAAALKPAFVLAQQFVDLAGRLDEPTYQLVGHRLLGTVQFFMGQNREALENLEQAEKNLDPSTQTQLSHRFGQDPGITLLCYKTMTLFMLGRANQAAHLAEEVRMDTGGHYHAQTVAHCRFMTTIWPEFLFGDLVGRGGHRQVAPSSGLA
jgi:hypothetical protein